MATPSRAAARRISAARLISLTGSEAAFTALLFVLFERTGSSRWISAALLLTFGARGALTPVAGALGDRFDRRRVMIASDLLGAACFAALALTDSPAALLVLAFLAAVAETPFFPAASASVPNLVTGPDLAWANSTIAFGANVGYLTGPALGGVLVTALGAPVVFLLNAVSFVLSAGLVATVRGSFRVDRHDDDLHQGVRAGFRFLLSEPTLRVLTLAFAVFAIAIGGVLVAELPLAESFDVGAFGFGLIATCFGAGALAGSLGGRLLNETNERKVLVTASFVTALAFGAVAGAPGFAFVLLAMLVAGAADGLVDVGVELMLQRLSPDSVRSRVIAALEAIFLLGLTLAFVFAGPLVDAWGPRAAYAIAGAGLVVATVMLLPLLRSGPRATPQGASTGKP